MDPFDPLASAHDAFWSFFTAGPLGLAAQCFVDPLTTAASPAPRAEAQAARQPEPLDHAPAVYDGSIAKAQARSAGRSVELPVPEAGEPQWLTQSFKHDEVTHHFKLFVPSGYHGQPLPMIVMLHGAQQGPDDFATGTEMNTAAEAANYIVVYPEQSTSANPFACWNWFRPADQRRESGETAMVAALTREVMAAWQVDDARVYVAGLSAGGAMAVNLAVTHPDLYAAAAIHSGLPYGVADEPLAALCAMHDGMSTFRLPEHLSGAAQPRAVPLIVFHGDADDTVHPRNSDQIIAMHRLLHGVPDAPDAPNASPAPALTPADASGNGHAYTRRVLHDAAGMPVGEQWSVHGMGHAWSGGHPDGTHTDSRGPHATREIIRFFSQFSLAL